MELFTSAATPPRRGDIEQEGGKERSRSRWKTTREKEDNNCERKDKNNGREKQRKSERKGEERGEAEQRPGRRSAPAEIAQSRRGRDTAFHGETRQHTGRREQGERREREEER